MRIEVITNDTPSQREVWVFGLRIDLTSTLYFDAYRHETKASKRCKWKVEKCWLRLFSRESNTPKPTVPEEVIQRVREEIKSRIDLLRPE